MVYSGAHASTNLLFTQSKVQRVIRLVLTAAVILTILGGTETTSDSASERKTGSTLRKVGSFLILAVLILFTIFHLMLWSVKQSISVHRRTVSIS